MNILDKLDTEERLADTESLTFVVVDQAVAHIAARLASSKDISKTLVTRKSDSCGYGDLDDAVEASDVERLLLSAFVILEPIGQAVLRFR